MTDVQEAKQANQKIKLVSDISVSEGGISLIIAPEYIDSNDPLYSIDWEQNAIVIYGKHSGALTLQGAGADANPTAAAMVSDLLNAQTRKRITLKSVNMSIH